MSNISNFISLIQLSLGNDVPIPKDINWKDLYENSYKQAILGICFVGFQRIRQKHTDIQIPDRIRFQWLAHVMEIQDNNNNLSVHCIKLQEELNRFGIRSSILKGQAIAQLYGEELSLFRTPGDIDIYVDCGRERAFAYAKTIGMHNIQWDYKHLHLNIYDGIEVEMHYVPEILLNIQKNKRLQLWFKEHKEEFFSISNGFITPSIKFNLFYILLHIYRHFLYEGVGLRQLIDYYFVLKAANGEYREEINAVFAKFGMVSFAKGIMWIMKNVFLLDDSYLLCNPDDKEGEYIFSEILMGGNFGHYDKRLSNTLSGKIGAVCRIMKHNLHILTHYPSDVIWAPIWFLYHWFWKRFYLLRNKALLMN